MDTRTEDKESLGFYRLRLDDSGVLYEFDMEPEDRQLNIQRLKHPGIYVFANKAETVLVAYEPAYGKIPWLTGHAYTSPKGRGVPLKELFWATGIWIFQNTMYEVITGVVPEHLRRYGLYLGAMGATRQYEFNGTVMYTYDATQVPEFEEKLRLLKEKHSGKS